VTGSSGTRGLFQGVDGRSDVTRGLSSAVADTGWQHKVSQRHCFLRFTHSVRACVHGVSSREILLYLWLTYIHELWQLMVDCDSSTTSRCDDGLFHIVTWVYCVSLLTFTFTGPIWLCAAFISVERSQTRPIYKSFRHFGELYENYTKNVYWTSRSFFSKTESELNAKNTSSYLYISCSVFLLILYG